MNTSLIQYMSSGLRRFKTMPILPHTRVNWEFYAVVQGRCGVLLDHDEKLSLRAQRLWVFPPGHIHGWHGEEEHCSVVVVHAASVPKQLVAAIPSSGILERRITTIQCRQIRAIERAIEPDYYTPSPLSELRFKGAIIDLAVMALGGEVRRFDYSTNWQVAEDGEFASAV
jgi:AraC family transcriptional regulator